MTWHRKFIFTAVFIVLIYPINLQANVNLDNMNLLKKVDINSEEDELVTKLYFEKDLENFLKPIFYKKSIQIDFPRTYSEPTKRFLTTGNNKISQIYVSQYNSQKMRIRFILGKGEEEDYKGRFHLETEGNLLTVRINLKKEDLLDKLLANVASKIEEKNQLKPINKISDETNKKYTSDKPTFDKNKKYVEVDKDAVNNGLSEKIKLASFNKNPQWKNDKEKGNKPLDSSATKSFNFLNRDKKKQLKSADVASSGFKMIMTLSLVLGLIFILFFGFKKYVLKNTIFGGSGRQVKVVSTNYLAPKKNISLVEIAGEILVLGISDQNISLLTKINDPQQIKELKNIQGDEVQSVNSKNDIIEHVAKNVSSATSNAKNSFSKYLKEFSGTETKKEASVAAVTKKIRQHMGKVRSNEI